MRVAIVTDSTACLPPDTARGAGITVVPLHVTVGDTTDLTAREISPEEIADLLARGKERVSTSRPSPGELAAVYREVAAGTGVTELVSVHLSSAVSGTVEAARLAAAEVADTVRVTVVDSRQIGLGTGYAALAAAEAAGVDGAGEPTGGGAGPVEEAAGVAEVAARSAAQTRSWFYVHTLEHLRRGGRIGTAAALLGSALAIKPLLTVRDGEVALQERVRTRGKALARLVDHVAARVEELDGRVRLGVHHLAAAEGAEELAQRLSVMSGVDAQIVELDPVVSVHTGPGTLAVVVAPTVADLLAAGPLGGEALEDGPPTGE